METTETTPGKTDGRWAVAIAALAGIAFYFSAKPAHAHFDYTFRIASAFLHGQLGPTTQPPSWLNEMVPQNGNYYSVFPLGAVLALVPVALLKQIGLVANFPARAVAAIVAGFCIYLFLGLSKLWTQSFSRRIFLALFPVFGTWVWCNLGFAGAWQIALGLALVGETGALYFTLVRPKPLAAGALFALGFGNRTELLLVLPIYLWFWLRRSDQNAASTPDWISRLRERQLVLFQFLIVPTALALLTAIYNFGRFHSIFDFGYSHIPNVLQEPWYEHGLFSLHAIPWNVHKMLFEGFGDEPDFPFVRFFPFGCSIFLASPILCLLFREGGSFVRPAWLAIAVLTFALWCHGNPGGWQFSYRYAIILIPWMFLLIAENGPNKISAIEGSLFVISVAINAVATYLFLWTDQIHP